VIATLEWNWDTIYDFRRGTVGGDSDSISYPVYVPHDFSQADPEGNNADWRYRSSIRAGGVDHVLEADRQRWLPIVATPKTVDSEIAMMWSDSNDDKDPYASNVRWPVPYMNINGERKTKTDLHMGNVNPITGKFQPPSFLYAEHVVWDTEEDATEAGEDSELKTSWFYLRHWTYKHYGAMGKLGSNFARRTKRYGKLPDGGDHWEFNWARFYDDGFANGTIDEFYWVNFADKENLEPFNKNRYVDPESNEVQHVGYFHRSSEHEHDETYWNVSSSEPTLDKFNFYAEEDQKVLVGDQDETLRVTGIAHTQYRPRDGYRGRDYNANGQRVEEDNLSETERPRFEISFRTESGQWLQRSYENEETAPQGRWLGEPVEPQELFGEPLEAEDGDDIKYRVQVENPRTPMNVTPFLESISVMYQVKRLKSLSYYSP
jgi:hypothetical protein